MRPALLSMNWLLALEQSRARVLESWDFQNFFSVAKESLLIFFFKGSVFLFSMNFYMCVYCVKIVN